MCIVLNAASYEREKPCVLSSILYIYGLMLAFRIGDLSLSVWPSLLLHPNGCILPYEGFGAT